MNPMLLSGALLGFVSVAFGAYAEHGLKPVIEEETFRFVMTAIRYNQVYAAIVTGIGVALCFDLAPALSRHLFRAGAIFTIATLLFSFSIYASAQFAMPSLTYMTPVGGVTFMVGWLYLAYVALRHAPGPVSRRPSGIAQAAE